MGGNTALQQPGNTMGDGQINRNQLYNNQQPGSPLASIIGNAPSQPIVGNNPPFHNPYEGQTGQWSPYNNEYHGFNQYANGFGGFHPNGQPMQQPNLGYIQQPTPTVGGNIPSYAQVQPGQLPQGLSNVVQQGNPNVAQPMGGLGAIPPRTA
jgi:hypothetical protein